MHQKSGTESAAAAATETVTPAVPTPEGKTPPEKKVKPPPAGVTGKESFPKHPPGFGTEKYPDGSNKSPQVAEQERKVLAKEIYDRSMKEKEEREKNRADAMAQASAAASARAETVLERQSKMSPEEVSALAKEQAVQELAALRAARGQHQKTPSGSSAAAAADPWEGSGTRPIQTAPTGLRVPPDGTVNPDGPSRIPNPPSKRDYPVDLRWEPEF